MRRPATGDKDRPKSWFFLRKVNHSEALEYTRDIMHQSGRWMIAAHLEKRALLVVVNLLAGMSIFFFGKVDH